MTNKEEKWKCGDTIKVGESSYPVIWENLIDGFKCLIIEVSK
jgi:hypothetical protein